MHAGNIPFGSRFAAPKACLGIFWILLGNYFVHMLYIFRIYFVYFQNPY